MGFEEKCVFAILLFRGSQAVSSPARRVIDLLEFPIRMGIEQKCVFAILLFRGSQAVSSPARRVIELLESGRELNKSVFLPFYSLGGAKP